MPNVNIKKEKEDNSYSDDRTETSNNPVQARVVSLKSTKAPVKGKSSSNNLKAIKVKTLQEIKEEKKKGDLVKSSSANQTGKNARPDITLRSLSVPVSLMCLHTEYPGKRTFRVRSLPNNVKIKKEPVDEAENSEPAQLLNSVTFSSVKVKQESEDDLDYNREAIVNTVCDDMNALYNNRKENLASIGDASNSDLTSEESSFDGHIYGPSIDFSDVPRGTPQDEDSMSLFADETFEEESELDELTRKSEHLRKQAQSENFTDLRETLEQNRSLQRNTSHEDEFDRQCRLAPEQISVNRHHHKGKTYENKNRRRKKLEKHGDRVQQGNKSMQALDELARAQMLFNVVKKYTVKQGVIPQKKTQPDANVNGHYDISNNNFRQPVPTVTPQELKRRPPVPGGRGFFEDLHVTKEATVNGNLDDLPMSWNKKEAFKDIDLTGSVINNKTNRNEAKSYNTLKRRSTEEVTSNCSESEPKVPKRTQNTGQADSTQPYHHKRPKQLYCNTQMQLGKCDFAFCKFKHLTESELKEYKTTGEMKDQIPLEKNRSENKVETPNYEINTDHSSEVSEDDDEQMYKGLMVAANQAMDCRKLREAFQIILYLYDTVPNNHHSLIPLVERLLVLCGEENVDLQVAAQVSAQAFDLIPKVRGDYNRHDFTNLIRCLCQTGQYIRAYEALDEMKALNLSPTHEVFLDLINSSHKHPLRAFELLDEIKSLGLFRSSICSNLILLSCKAKVPLVGRTWALFKDMMDKSVKPSKESFLALLDLLADNYEVDKLLQALVLYDDNTVQPSEKCNKLVIKHSKDNSDMVSQCVKSVSEMQQPQLDDETWNDLLSNCYSKTFNLSMKAQQVQNLMKKFNIPFLAQGYNGLLCSLSEANLTMAAIDVIKDVINDNISLAECKQGMTAAVNALMRNKQLEDLTNIILLLIDHGIMVEEKPLLTVLQALEASQAYEKMHQIFKKCEKASLTMTVACFRKIYLSLEKWAQNPAASLDVYTTMKLAYPIIPDSSDSEKRHEGNSKRPICKYFFANRCNFGSKCRFSHPAHSSDEESTSIPTEQSNPFVLRATIPKETVLPAPPLPPPLPPPFSLSMNPLITVASFPPVVEPWKIPTSQANPKENCIPNSSSLPHSTSPDLSSLKQERKPSSSQIIDDLKTEVYLYEDRINAAKEEQNFEELARIYVEMKNDKIPVCNEMLRVFYSSFTSFSNIGESLSSFVAIIDIQLDNPDCDEAESRESLDSEDHKFIGELGVALMQLCRSQQRLDEGYLVLHVLHQYSINYFQYPASFVPTDKVLSSPSIALLAADMCLCLEKDPQYDGAIEVLRGCNYALPQEESYLSIEETEKRRDTIHKIIGHYLSIKEYDIVYEFLKHVGDSDVFGIPTLKTMYNKLLKGYIDEKKVEDAISVIGEMESELIPRDTQVLRSLVTCLGSIGRFMQAKEIFRSSCLQGAYPPFPQGTDLWHATVWASFSKFEVHFYLEQHLQLLNKHVEQQRIASQMPYDEQHLRKLRITIASEENTSAANLKIVKEVQERVIEILGSEFNPPLSCGISDVIGEVLVNPRSLKRWFIANPTPESQRSPSNSDSNEIHQRNVSATAGNISVRVDMQNENSVEHLQKEKIRHTICGQLTRHMRNGVIVNKEEFKQYAHIILEDYFKQNIIPAQYNREQRTRVIRFVEKYFDKGTNHT